MIARALGIALLTCATTALLWLLGGWLFVLFGGGCAVAFVIGRESASP